MAIEKIVGRLFLPQVKYLAMAAPCLPPYLPTQISSKKKSQWGEERGKGRKD